MPDSAGRPEREPDTGAPLDLKVLAALTGGDRREMRSLLQDFLAALTIDLDEMRQACARDEASRIAQLAHKIHGASTLIGASELARMVADVERAANTGDITAAAMCCAGLPACVQRVRAQLQETLSG